MTNQVSTWLQNEIWDWISARGSSGVLDLDYVQVNQAFVRGQNGSCGPTAQRIAPITPTHLLCVGNWAEGASQAGLDVGGFCDLMQVASLSSGFSSEEGGESSCLKRHIPPSIHPSIYTSILPTIHPSIHRRWYFISMWEDYSINIAI